MVMLFFTNWSLNPTDLIFEMALILIQCFPKSPLEYDEFITCSKSNLCFTEARVSLVHNIDMACESHF